MPNQELITFIQNSRIAGQTDDQIRFALKQSGWQDAVLDEAFRPQVIRAPLPSVTQNFQSPVITDGNHTSGKKIFLSVIIVVVLLLGAASVAYYFYASNKTSSETSSVSTTTSTQQLPIVAQSEISTTTVTAPTQTQSTSTGPKETLLAMGKDLSQLMVGMEFKDSKDTDLLVKSTVFAQFINRYMTAASVKEFEAFQDIQKTMFFMFGLVLVVPDQSSIIKGNITGSTATFNYSRSGGSMSDNVSKTDLIAKCTVKMVLENGSWKLDYTNGNVACTNS